MKTGYDIIATRNTIQIYTNMRTSLSGPRSRLATDARLQASQRPEITWPSLSLVMGTSPN